MKYLITILIFLSTALYSKNKTDQLPNIVLFFADDLGYADLGCYGHPYAKTPNLDKLASEGIRFTQHYVTGVTCNPSRTGLMTGLFPARYQKKSADFGFGEQVTITELLKQRGYKTGHFGKWHIGPKSSEVDGMYGLDQISVIGNSKDKSAGRDDDLVTKAIDFMKDNKDKPFYVNIWGHSTHFAVHVPPNLSAHFIEQKVRRSDFSQTMQHKFDESLDIDANLDKSMHQYLGDVYSIDQNMKRVLKTIKDLGIEENTIIVFSSDHGPAPVLGSKGVREYSKNMLGYAGEFRGGKHTQFEGGVRVPFIIRWPGKIKAGVVDEESVTSFIDWLPTLCSIVGIKNIPDDLDGEDVSDIWFGKSRKRVKPLFWQTSKTGSTPAMREGKWKLHFGNKKDPGIKLYDLSLDVSESKNLAEKFPDVLKQMESKLNAWVQELPKSYEKKAKKNKNKKKKK